MKRLGCVLGRETRLLSPRFIPEGERLGVQQGHIATIDTLLVNIFSEVSDILTVTHGVLEAFAISAPESQENGHPRETRPSIDIDLLSGVSHANMTS